MNVVYDLIRVIIIFGVIYIIYKIIIMPIYLRKTNEPKKMNHTKNLINTNQYNMSEDIHAIKNILVYFCVLSIIGLIGALLIAFESSK